MLGELNVTGKSCKIFQLSSWIEAQKGNLGFRKEYAKKELGSGRFLQHFQGHAMSLKLALWRTNPLEIFYGIIQPVFQNILPRNHWYLPNMWHQGPAIIFAYFTELPKPWEPQGISLCSEQPLTCLNFSFQLLRQNLENQHYLKVFFCFFVSDEKVGGMVKGKQIRNIK